MKRVSIIFLMLISTIAFSQKDTTDNTPVNTADVMINDVNRLTIGGYGQVDYNQKLNPDNFELGNLDVHRLVMLFGYKFNLRTNFITEIEFEHVNEVYVEQAFINYKVTDYINFRSGLLLIPMGIVNEYHEPPTFNGVERPNLDKVIVPTTWREIGAGFTGKFDEIGLKYQLYILNGFSGYDGSAKFSGKGLRSGRQKGAESFMNSPSFSGKIDFYGLRGLKLGFASYFGKSNSILYSGLDKNDPSMIAKADSSVVGISMYGADLRYTYKGIQLKGQYNFIKLNNTEQYNLFTESNVGNKLHGFYTELAFNVFRPFKLKTELIPFIRYENYDTHYSVDALTTDNRAYHVEEIIFGLGWKLAGGAMLKADFQKVKNHVDNNWKNQLNIGLGVMF